MLASRVFSRPPRSVYVHCPDSFLFSPSQNQQFQILFKNFHYLCESPNKLAICKASLLHHAALSSSACRPTKEEVINFEEKLWKFLEDSNCSTPAKPEQKSIDAKIYIPVKVLGPEDINKVSQQTEESCFKSKSQPTKSQSVVKTRISTNARPANTSGDAKVAQQKEKSSCDSKSQATKSQTLSKGKSTKRTTCSNSNSKGKSELLMDDLVKSVTNMNSILEWKCKKIMKAEGKYCQRHAKLVEEMEKLKKQAERTNTMSKFVIGFPIVFVIACMWMC